MFASKYSFLSIFQVLQDSHIFAPLRIQNTRKNSSNFFWICVRISAKNHDFSTMFTEFGSDFDDFFSWFRWTFYKMLRRLSLRILRFSEETWELFLNSDKNFDQILMWKVRMVRSVADRTFQPWTARVGPRQRRPPDPWAGCGTCLLYTSDAADE